MRLVLVLSICGLFLGTANSFAQGLESGHSWGAGTESSYIKYDEPGRMYEKGVMHGVVGFYSYTGEMYTSNPYLSNYMLKAEGRISFGGLDYRSSDNGDIDDTDNFITELRGLGGYGFSITENISITPYIGFGYRHLKDDLGGKVSSTGAFDYDRDSTYLYVPLGAEANIELGNNWSVGATAEYDIFLWGKYRSHLSQQRNDFNDPENTQRHGFGLRGALRITRKTEKIDLIIEPFIRYWKLRDSQETGLTLNNFWIRWFSVPKNSSTELGVRFAIKF